uniref:BTB domain-containing protein n=1 Tax=Macrostomum lignano TaxID=282301 RepID=A0A1I8F333_9PLAT
TRKDGEQSECWKQVVLFEQLRTTSGRKRGSREKRYGASPTSQYNSEGRSTPAENSAWKPPPACHTPAIDVGREKPQRQSSQRADDSPQDSRCRIAVKKNAEEAAPESCTLLDLRRDDLRADLHEPERPFWAASAIITATYPGVDGQTTDQSDFLLVDGADGAVDMAELQPRLSGVFRADGGRRYRRGDNARAAAARCRRLPRNAAMAPTVVPSRIFAFISVSGKATHLATNERRRSCRLPGPTVDRPANEARRWQPAAAAARHDQQPASSAAQLSSDGCERIRLNVSGMHFETARWASSTSTPRTLLGNTAAPGSVTTISPGGSTSWTRHRPTFEAVFNYYQYGGKLKRPPTVTDDIFLSELEFYDIEREVIEAYKKDEGYISETVVLPEHPLAEGRLDAVRVPGDQRHGLRGGHPVGAVHRGLHHPLLRRDAQGSACTAWFTVELLVRFIVCPCKKAFIKDVKNAVDLSAIVPYYVTLTNVLVTMSCEGAKSSASLAFLRVVRLIRVFKLTKHSADLQVLVLTFRASIEGLGLFLVALIVCILLFSSTIYYVESEVKGSQIESIPDAFWWAVITMCTVGYGDKVPKGPLGKVVGSVCAVAGVLTLAIPVPIITENFNKFYTHKTGRAGGLRSAGQSETADAEEC